MRFFNTGSVSLKTFLLFFFTFSVVGAFSQPSITSFSPASGPVGATVTISGSGFSAAVNNNIVFFGPVKAAVLSATASSLVVQVPVGSNFEPITVTTNSLTAYSAKPFVITFPDGNDLKIGTRFYQCSFENQVDSATDLHPREMALADFDGDGRVDIATANFFSISGLPGSLSILRNTGTPYHVSFAPVVNIANGSFTMAVAVGDLDGDGKTDMVASSITTEKISIFKNSSAIGNISFSAPLEYAVLQEECIKIYDVDLDGKPDIIVGGGVLSNQISIFRNTSSNGVLSFAPRLDFFANASPSALTICDLDGDKKPDLAVSNTYFNTVSILRNSSTPGTVSFSAPQTITTLNQPYAIASGDLDGDGKADLATANYGTGNISILRNNSSVGNIAFDTKIDYSTGANPTGISIADLNGDGKPDVVVPSQNLTALQNNCLPGTISFTNAIYLYPAATIQMAAISDFDGDGKNDIAGCGSLRDVVSIFRNKNDEPTIFNFNPIAAAAGTTVTIDGVGFNNANALSFEGVPATSFTVVSNYRISTIVPLTVSGNITLATPRGTDTASGFIYAAPPTIASFTPTTAGYSTAVTITGTNFTGVTSVSFGGVNASSFTIESPRTITAFVPITATSGNITVTNLYGTATAPGFTFIPVPFITSFSPISAPAGGTITINGSNLNYATAVYFGGVPAASFQVISPSMITAVIGAGASGEVKVVSGGGTAIKADFTILPTITSFSPSSSGGGGTVTLTGQNFSGVTGIMFGPWSANYQLNSSTSITAVVPFGYGLVDITLITRAGNVSIPGFVIIPSPVISLFSPVHGGSGTLIIITGKNFTNASSVTIGGQPASNFTVVSDSSITAIVPKTTSGSIEVSTPGGKVARSGFLFVTTPVINSVQPLSAPPNASVTITGANFSSNPQEDFVYFGSVRAVVQSATPNLLTVTVPFGAIHSFITVSTGYSTGYSRELFTPMASAVNIISPTTYRGRINFATGTNPTTIRAGDIDGDGKVDLVLIYSKMVSIYRNITASNVLKFDRTDIATKSNLNDVEIADINSDGKLDILVTETNAIGVDTGQKSALSILENTSIPGTISFKAIQSFLTAFNPAGFTVGDLHFDGKPDIAVAAVGQSTVSIFKNKSSNGTIALYDIINTSLYDYENVGPSDVCIADINGSEFPSMIVGTAWRTFFSVLKDEYSSPVNYPIMFGGSSGYMTPVDFNGDHKIDFLVRDGFIINQSYFNGFSYTTSLTTQIRVNMGGIVAIGDLNGDNKPDIVRCNTQTASVSALINTSSGNTFSNAPEVSFQTGNSPGGIAIADLDADGKPEIITTNSADQTFSVLRDDAVIENCEGAGSTLSATKTGSSYQWQENSGSGFKDIINNNLFQGIATNKLSVSATTAALNGNQYRCVVDGIADSVYTLTVNTNTAASVTIATNAQYICPGATIYFSSKVTNGGTAPSYQWQLNNVNVGTNSSSYSTDKLSTNDKISLAVTSNASCVTAPALSNVISISLTPSVKPSVSLSRSPTAMCSETKVTFTATPDNGGNAPGYLWQVNNITVASNSNTFVTTGLKNNDVVKVILYSNAVCSSPQQVSSADTIALSATVASLGSITAPQEICGGRPYNISLNGNIAPGSAIQLFEAVNAAPYFLINTLTYGGSSLNFPLNATYESIRNYFIKIIPPANSCYTASTTDTVKTNVIQLDKPLLGINGLTLTVANPDSRVNYKWQMQDASGNWADIVPSANSTSYTPVQTGTFRLMASRGPCIEYSQTQLISNLVTAVGQVNTEGRLLWYPNPVNDVLVFDSLKLLDNWKTLNIVNLETGQTIRSYNIFGQTKLVLPLKELTTGSYVAILRRKDGSSISIKFLKM